MLDFAREGDVIYIHDLSRLARNIRDLLEILELLDKKKIHLVSNKEKIDTSTPTGRLMITIILSLIHICVETYENIDEYFIVNYIKK